MVRVQELGTGTRCGLGILRSCCKGNETKRQIVLGANFYVCRSYRGESLGGLFGVPCREWC